MSHSQNSALFKNTETISCGGGGHAMAQAVSRWPPRTGIGPRPVQVGLMVGNVAQGQVSVRVFACFILICSRMTDFIKSQQ
jgi:hypothetical protein